MPRTQPSTSWGDRSPPASTWEQTRRTWENFLLKEDSFKLLLEDWGCILLEVLTSDYETPRYAKYVEDMTGINVFDLSGNSVCWISGNETNKIDTVYT